MKMKALVLMGLVLGLGLVFLPTLGATSLFHLGASTQYSGEGKNTTGTGGLDVVPTATEGNSVYRSISESPAGPYGVPAAVLAIGIAAAAGTYLITKRRVP